MPAVFTLPASTPVYGSPGVAPPRLPTGSVPGAANNIVPFSSNPAGRVPVTPPPTVSQTGGSSVGALPRSAQQQTTVSPGSGVPGIPDSSVIPPGHYQYDGTPEGNRTFLDDPNYDSLEAHLDRALESGRRTLVDGVENLTRKLKPRSAIPPRPQKRDYVPRYRGGGLPILYSVTFNYKLERYDGRTYSTPIQSDYVQVMGPIGKLSLNLTSQEQHQIGNGYVGVNLAHGSPMQNELIAQREFGSAGGGSTFFSEVSITSVRPLNGQVDNSPAPQVDTDPLLRPGFYAGGPVEAPPAIPDTIPSTLPPGIPDPEYPDPVKIPDTIPSTLPPGLPDPEYPEPDEPAPEDEPETPEPPPSTEPEPPPPSPASPPDYPQPTPGQSPAPQIPDMEPAEPSIRPASPQIDVPPGTPFRSPFAPPEIPPAQPLNPSPNPDTPTTPTPQQQPGQSPQQQPGQFPQQTPSTAPSPQQQPGQTPQQTPSTAPSPQQQPGQTPQQQPGQLPSQIPQQTPSQSPANTPQQTPSQSPGNHPSSTPTQSPSTSPGNHPPGTPSPAPNSPPTTNPQPTLPSNTPQPSTPPSNTPQPSTPPATSPSPGNVPSSRNPYPQPAAPLPQPNCPPGCQPTMPSEPCRYQPPKFVTVAVKVFKACKAGATASSTPASSGSSTGTYEKGSWEGILVLKDNSKIIVNAKDRSECAKVINALKINVPVEYRTVKGKPAKAKIGERINSDLKQCKVTAIRASFFSTGQRDMKPDWSIDLRKK